LERNVLSAYSFLINNYNLGDEIFCFGFSRGAYTARCIAGLVSEVGILPKAELTDLAELYDRYRMRHKNMKSWKDFLDEKKKYYSEIDNQEDHISKTKIKVCGVWDTVGALGIPQTAHHSSVDGNHKFHDTTLSSSEFHSSFIRKSQPIFHIGYFLPRY
jgi:uncharacterized protein (DUF2235 family)